MRQKKEKNFRLRDDYMSFQKKAVKNSIELIVFMLKKTSRFCFGFSFCVIMI